MIGTFLRFFLLRVIGARGAAILGVIAFILGRRRQRDLPRRDLPPARRNPARRDLAQRDLPPPGEIDRTS